MLAGVIWMLGWCMMIVAAFVGLPARRVGAIGIAIVEVLQFLFVGPVRVLPEGAANVIGPLWEFIYPADHEALFGINILYVIVPWIGVMMAGFGFASLLERPDDSARRRLMHAAGLGMTGGVASARIDGRRSRSHRPLPERRRPATGPPLWMSVLDQQKYPASLLFLMMTLGPLIALTPFGPNARSGAAVLGVSSRPSGACRCGSICSISWSSTSWRSW